jgi:hypothetical protein
MSLFEGEIPPGSRRGLAQAIIASGVEQGLPGSIILETLRKYGLGYRTQDFYEDYRRISGGLMAKRIGYSVSDDAYPGFGTRYASLHPPEARYRFRFEAITYDPETGEFGRRYIYIQSDRMDRVGVFREQASKLADRYADQYGWGRVLDVRFAGWEEG